MEFKPWKKDHDLWMRNKGDQWGYIAACVDDLLVFSSRPMEISERIREKYDLKGVRELLFQENSSFIEWGAVKLESISAVLLAHAVIQSETVNSDP